ncbi:MAG: hypothetical protein M1548_06270 [Actinobacteria bacterium]|nr:hypothetical protein [Actinomycetota bacterium]
MTNRQVSLDDEVYTVSSLESTVARTLVFITALATLSYFPMIGYFKIPVGPTLFYSFSLLALLHVVWLAVVERAVRIPRSTLALPAALFFLVLAMAKLNPRPPLGPADPSFINGSLADSALLALMAYLGYVFVDSRRDRRRLLVLTSFLLTTTVILDGARMAIVALGYAGAGRPTPMPNNGAEMGLYISFALPFLAAQVMVRRSWLSRYAFVPPLIAASIYAITTLPVLALFTMAIGFLLVPSLINRSSTIAATSLLMVFILLVAVLVGGRAPLGGWPKVEKAQLASESAVAKELVRDVGRVGGPATGQLMKMGAASVLLFLVLVAAFFMQGVPSLVEKSDVERAFILGVLGGVGGYAVASVAYGSSIVVSPAVWLMVGAGARLTNPLKEPVLKLSIRRLTSREASE